MCGDWFGGDDGEDEAGDAPVAQVMERKKADARSFSDRDALSQARRNNMNRSNVKTSSLGLVGGQGGATNLGGV